MISIHAPAKGATRIQIICNQAVIISIHAPAKGATFCLRMLPSNYHISIHAPAKGATMLHSIHADYPLFQSTLPQRERRCTLLHCRFRTNFNPRSRKGSDFTITKFAYYKAISIHAPAKGATRNSSVRDIVFLFQSTLPQRERRGIVGIKAERCYFNPRSRKGSDKYCLVKVCFINISIHAPAKGATTLTKFHISLFIVFQSTLPQRERLYM